MTTDTKMSVEELAQQLFSDEHPGEVATPEILESYKQRAKDLLELQLCRS